jgi:hypothetical protein
MRRVAAAAAAGVLALLVIAGPALAQEGEEEPATTGAPVTADDGQAIDDLVGCVKGSQRLLVLFLIDESRSLGGTDPDDRRVDAAQGALTSLIDLASGGGTSAPQVDVAMAAFSNEFRPVQDWTEASEATAEELAEALDQFAEFDQGTDTDFVNALAGASDSLGTRAAEVSGTGSAPCRAVLLFTDGAYDIGVRATPEQREELGSTKVYAPDIELTSEERVREAERAGRQALCEPGGVADQLRAEETTLLAVALSGDVARRAQLPLAAAAAGQADDYTCGDPEAARGTYVPADDIDRLLVRFNEIGARLAGGNLVETSDRVVCDDERCDDGRVDFELDATLRRAQLLVLPAAEGAEVEIAGPGGGSVRVDGEGEQDLDGIVVRSRTLAGRGLAIDLERPDDDEAWIGEWQAWVRGGDDVAGEAAVVQVFVFSDIVATFTAEGSVVRGAEVPVSLSIAVPDGSPVEDVVEQATAEARVRDTAGGEPIVIPLAGPPTGPFTGTLAIPADLTANAVQVTSEVRITTKAGAELLAQAAPQDLLVRRPGDAIQFAPPTLAFPAITGEGTSEADLILTGGETDGCVWFGEPDLGALPEGVAGIDLLIDDAPLPDEDGCIPVEAGGRQIITVVAVPDGRGTGAIRANLTVLERTEGVDEASTTQLATRLDLARGVNQARRLAVAIGLLGLGLAIPLGLLVVLNALTARFQQLDRVRAASIPVQISQRIVSRMDAGYPRAFILRDDDFRSLADAGTSRRFTFGGIVFRARASRNPFGEMSALAAPEGGAEKLRGKEGSKVELEASLARSWVFLLDPDLTRRLPRGDAAGKLIAFVGESTLHEDLATMVPDIQARAPRIADHLAGLVRQATPSAAKRKAAAKAAAVAAPEAGAAEDDEHEAEVDVGVDVVEPEAPDATDAPEPPDDDAPPPPVGFSGGPRP